MRLSYRARTLWAAGALSLLPLAACEVKDQLLQPQQPGLIQPGDVAGVAGADALYIGALGRLKSWAVGGNVNQESMFPMMALMTDEYKSSDTFSQRNETDQRTVQTSDALVQSVYTQAQQGRGYALDALNDLLAAEPKAGGKIGEMYFAMGFAEMILGEVYCNGIPLGEMKNGQPDYTVPLSSSDALKTAAAHFDSALASAASAKVPGDLPADTVIARNVTNAASIAKARVLVDLGQFSDAAAAVANVATAYQYVETFAQTSQDNGFWIMTTNSQRYSVGDSVDATGTIANAIPFASAGDPRVPSAKNTLKPFDNQTLPYFVQTMFGRDDAIALLDGTDARLIEAEAKLNAGDYAGMMGILNALRTSPPTQGIFKPAALAAIATVPATKDSAVTLFFREKAFWQFSRGYRFGDLRRMVRQYARPSNQVWPSGTFFKGGSYGPDVNFPVTDNEKTNPNFTGCIDRSA
jgi:hypothetical protein